LLQRNHQVRALLRLESLRVRHDAEAQVRRHRKLNTPR
jgi:hypothetical protein